MRLYFQILLASLILLSSCKNSIPTNIKTTNSDVETRNLDHFKIDEEQQILHLKHLSSEQFEGRATGHKGGLLARDYIAKEFKAIGLLPYNDSYTQSFKFNGKSHHKSPNTTMAHNVLGLIRGTKKSNKFIVIGAHYDHLGVINGKVYNGADDNASGTAALFSLAKYFVANPPKHTIIFAAWDAEELGLQGARHFLNEFNLPKENIVVNINIDMIGRNKDNELYICGTNHYKFLKKIIHDKVHSDVIKVRYGHDGADNKDDWTFASDHGPFHQKGIPFLYFGVEDHPDYHKETDEFESIQQAFYLEATKIVLQATLAIDKD